MGVTDKVGIRSDSRVRPVVIFQFNLKVYNKLMAGENQFGF